MARSPGGQGVSAAAPEGRHRLLPPQRQYCGTLFMRLATWRERALWTAEGSRKLGAVTMRNCGVIKPWIFEFFPAPREPDATGDPRRSADYFNWYLDLWPRAEPLGYEGIFFSEHHFGLAYSPCPQLLIAQISRADEDATARGDGAGSAVPPALEAGRGDRHAGSPHPGPAGDRHRRRHSAGDGAGRHERGRGARTQR